MDEGRTGSNVVLAIVRRNLCVGCGVCAGVCPAKCLTMTFNPCGEYIAALTGHCTDCGLCLKVCPFCDGEWTEDTLGKERFASNVGIGHCGEMGFFHHLFAGSIVNEGQRVSRTSGGLASWFLTELLRKGLVRRVLCVTGSGDSDRLFQYRIMEDAKEIWSASKSAYYPVELSAELREIIGEGGRCAIVGLPCTLKAIARAVKNGIGCVDNDPVLVGLTCGQQVSRLMTDWLIARSGVDVNQALSVSFREKSIAGHSNEFFFECLGAAGERGVVPWKGRWSESWGNGRFRLPACNCCDDLFAEVADASFMDAWIPERMKESKGESMVITRQPWITEVFESGVVSGELRLDTIDKELVVKSQAGALTRKRGVLSYRIAKAKRDGTVFPAKRQHLLGDACGASSRRVLLHDLRLSLVRQTARIVGARKGAPAGHLRVLIILLPCRVLDAIVTIVSWLCENVLNLGRPKQAKVCEGAAKAGR